MANGNENERIKIAWYENNMHFIKPVLFYLKKEEAFNVEIFGSPDTAELEIAGFGPDLIIFDYRMERINGVEMFKQLKKRGLKFVPVFFSIWANDDVTRDEIIEAGVESEAIFDKQIEPSAFPGALLRYYREKTGH